MHITSFTGESSVPESNVIPKQNIEMSDFSVCRVCLSDNIKVCTIANTQLQEIYENLTGIKLYSRDGCPVTVCFICLAQLQRCLKLVELAQTSEKLLLQLYHSGIELSQDTVLMLERVSRSYSVTPIESIHLQSESVSDFKEEKNVKEEGLGKDTGVVKDDPADVKVDFEYNDQYTSDSDDNIPLTALKLSSTEGKVKQQKRGYQKDVKIDASEVYLSKEQQLRAVWSRRDSLNYLNSPLKCSLCYKGFVSRVTYTNHVRKHEESSGAHACDVCALRYQSARLLRTHVLTAHARRYKCNKCEHVSHTTNQARDHDKWHEGFTFECQLCGQKFRKRTSYLTHTRKKHPTESVCELCGHSFVGSTGLLLHKSKTHRQDVEEQDATPLEDKHCKSCNIQFVKMDAYHRHLLSSLRHTFENNTDCIICMESHPDHGSLVEHMKVHKKKLLNPPAVVDPSSVQAQLPCDVCGTSFSCRSRLRAHVRRAHLGERPDRQAVCELCGLQFTSAGALRAHQRRHRGERPFPCGSCAARFAHAHQLRVHLRTHSGERPYACRTCQRCFAQKPALNRHYRVHTGAKPYSCPVCSKCFSQSNSLKVHVQSVHLKMPPHRKRKRGASKNDTET